MDRAVYMGAGAVVVFLTTVMISKTARAQEEQVAFERGLFDQQKLVVASGEVSEQEKQNLVKTALKMINPQHAAKIVLPDRFLNYRFYLVSADGKSKTVLWSRVVAEYEKEGIPTKSQVLDVAYDPKAKLLVVVCKETGLTAAFIVALNSPGGQDSTKLTPPEILTRDKEAFGELVTSANIQGSIGEDTLSVVLRKSAGQKVSFVWRNGKWSEENSPVAPPAPVKPPKVFDPEAPYRLQFEFQKELSPRKGFENELLVVYRQRLRVHLPEPAAFDPVAPGTSEPNFSYLYEFVYIKNDLRTILWSQRLESYGSSDASQEYRVLDATHQDGDLIYVYRHRNRYYANVVRSHTEQGLRDMAFGDTLLGDSTRLGVMASAIIHGSRHGKDLALTLTSDAVGATRFMLQGGKWVQVNE